MVQSYWTSIRDYVNLGPISTADGWTLMLPDGDFQEAIAVLIGLHKEAFITTAERPFITDFSAAVEIRSHWSKLSNTMLALAEVGHRMRLFPLLINVTDRYAISIQNYESAKWNLDTAKELQYAIIAFFGYDAIFRRVEKYAQNFAPEIIFSNHGLISF